ncbi:protein translocase subunit SecD [Aquifex aeolicus]|uniref:Protein translocase subunit SecD n=1 Tax=Aquifex aeolicus (strain VF5) TaxID=224324 RepID=SECD_AQUAE|nr:protein translocase subunit SecD [Aquifex aeolicus]O67102.1 RecName: Full=Protein translocase subunit SecD [Aquifex aeolicus VF5]AAC07060.1 protein export membrane protein SecD [Aquifex aeolicus VF5]
MILIMQKKNLWLHLLGLVILTLLSAYAVVKYPINLGLDLKGGVEFLLEPDFSVAIEREYEDLARNLREKLSKFNVLEVYATKEGVIIELLDKKEVENIKKVIQDINPNVIFEEEGDKLVVKFTQKYVEQLKEDIVRQSIEIIRDRIDKLGVTQPVVTRVGKYRILVDLPGFLDVERAKKIIGSTASLELKLVIDVSTDRKELEKKLTPDREILPSRDGREWFLVEKAPVITGQDLKTAYVGVDNLGQPAVNFELKGEAAEKFGKFTEQNIGKRLAIVLDRKVVSAPVIRSKISDRGQITGNFTAQEARDLALILRTGSLPSPLKFLQEKIVGPSLGKDAIEQGIKAGILAIILLAVVLIARYKTAGITANISIFLNVLFLLASMAFLGATLTLPGIAGIILNMGIAVDSNVLIFERVKEELRLGNTVSKAIELGFKRTLSAVWDTHVTLLVASVILFQFGSGPVKGFATTLALGTIASFISNVYYAKVFLDLLNSLKILKI